MQVSWNAQKKNMYELKSSKKEADELLDALEQVLKKNTHTVIDRGDGEKSVVVYSPSPLLHSLIQLH